MAEWLILAAGLSNREKMINELNDLSEIVEMLVEQGMLPDNWLSEEKKKAKRAKIIKYCDYARQRGTLSVNTMTPAMLTWHQSRPWVPVEGPGSKWKIVRGYSPVIEFCYTKGKPVIYTTMERAQQMADDLNKEDGFDVENWRQKGKNLFI